MDQSLIMGFLKELAVGFKSAKSYPPGHPVMDKVIDVTMTHLSKLFTEVPEFSMYFLEKTVIFQDSRIDVSKNAAIVSLLNALTKIEISSLTFEAGTTGEDVRNLYEVMSSVKMKIKQYGDAETLLQSKGTEKVKINAVTFGIQTGEAVQVASEPKPSMKHGEIIEAIRNLKHLVEQGAPALETENKLKEVINNMENAPEDSRYPYGEAVARIIEHLPAEHRIELLHNLELKPFILKLFSSLSEDTLTQLVMAKIGEKDTSDAKKIVDLIGEDRFSKMMPDLKKKIPNIMEYFAQVGIILSEKMASTVSKDDLRLSIKPYYTMLDSQHVHLREEGARALMTLASRFIVQKDYELANEIVSRICTALKQESVDVIILKLMEDVTGLYHNCKTHDQEKLCSMILDTFNKISGRSGLPIAVKKKIIQFLSETDNRAVLPILFSFLWESGIYPDVRAAIVKFGKAAIEESLSTLKVAEDHALMTRLVDVLKTIGEDSIEILLNNLDASEWTLRRNIVAILGDIGEKRVIHHLLDLLDDKDMQVRLELAKTFAKLGSTEGLHQSLKDKSVEVRAQALEGLRKIIAPEDVKELLPLFNEKGDAVHEELLKIIGEKEIDEAADSIVGLLKSLEARGDSAAQDLKEHAVSALLKLSLVKTKSILENFSHSKDKVLANLATNALKRVS
ncbi:MAG: HEAT repeat domain-containing protein [candidate division WOR-3 bacterium]|nr:MAG: HEAT repeat domain-containing protein [candidate division WOR-3 bacterium]